MLETFLISVAVVVVLFLVIVAMQPSEFRVTRTATISAPPSQVFPLVNDLHNWEKWSPWAKLDPNMKQTYEGAETGTGAVYTWSGDKNVGEGRMTIVESRAPELIRIKLEFLKPFAATNATEFIFTPSGGETNVEWSMTGTNNFIAKAMCLFMSMDKMVGKNFEDGLAQMKAQAESASKN